MVWGGIIGNRKTDLVVVQRYVADVLNAHDLPFIRQHGPGVTLMQDNARPYVVRITTQFLQQNNVNVIPWPTVSPDLNPISWATKHELTIRLTMFAILHGRYNRNGGISPNALVLRYVTSMRRRIIACIHANGGHIRY